MKDNALLLKDITWYDIDKNGYIKDKGFKNEGAVYIYMKIPSLNSKPQFYVGSSIRLANRISCHRWYIINWNKCKETGSGSPILYGSIITHGWSQFKLGVLEYLEITKTTEAKKSKRALLDREQYYLNNINPSLNVCKIANSPLGIKRNDTFSLNLSKSRRGISNKPHIKLNTIPRVVTLETKLKISLRCQGVSVKIYDKSNNLIKEFPTIASAALHLGLSTKTVGSIYKTGKSYDNYVYLFEIKCNRVRVYDNKNELIKIGDSIKQTSDCLNIKARTISNYLKSGKLYKNQYYFKHIEVQ